MEDYNHDYAMSILQNEIVRNDLILHYIYCEKHGKYFFDYLKRRYNVTLPDFLETMLDCHFLHLLKIEWGVRFLHLKDKEGKPITYCNYDELTELFLKKPDANDTYEDWLEKNKEFLNILKRLYLIYDYER